MGSTLWKTARHQSVNLPFLDMPQFSFFHLVAHLSRFIRHVIIYDLKQSAASICHEARQDKTKTAYKLEHEAGMYQQALLSV